MQPRQGDRAPAAGAPVAGGRYASIARELRMYGEALLAVVVGCMLRTLFDPWLGPRLPYFPFFAAVIFAAWRGGLGPGFVALVAGSLLSVFLFVSPRFVFAIDPVDQFLGFGVFLVVGLSITLLGGQARSARDRTERANEENRLHHERLQKEIAERRRVEGELRSQWEWFRLTLASIGDAVITTDAEGRVTFLNSAGERLTESTLAEAWNQPLRIGAPPPGWPDDVATILDGVFRGESTEKVETVRQRTDGSLADLSITASPIRDVAGALIGASIVARDVTEAAEAERRLRGSEERLRLALTAGNMGTWDWNIRTGEVLWSENLETIHGLEPGSFTGTFDAFRELVHPDDRERLVEAIRQSVETKGNYEIEFRSTAADGTTRWILGKGRVICDAAGEASRMIGIGMDVSSRKELELELEDISRRKDEFLATLAHELRNPLAPIRNALEILRLAGDDVSVREQSRGVLDRQVRQMVRLIDDLMDVSRISRGHIELRKERIALATAIESAVETSLPVIESYGLELDVKLPDESVFVEADPTRLAQIFANVLNNAAKYTEKGRISVRVETDDRHLTVIVADTGVGIDAHALERIFEMFAQGTPISERTEGGLGIGLSLVRALVEMHGGTIEARSEGPGRGSQFLVRLPRLPVGERTDAVEPQPEENGARVAVVPYRIVVVDDNRDSADSLSLVLSMMGHEVRIAYDGRRAIETVEEFRPHLVLLDIGLPGIDGYEVARRIRSQGYGRDLLLVAMTGWGQGGDKARCHAAGFDLHATKPLESSDFDGIFSCLRRRFQEDSRAVSA